MIWNKSFTLSDLKKVTSGFNHLANHIGIELLELGDDFLKARMPVDERTKMPLGLLHGGASCVLAETLGSYASTLVIDQENERMVGLEINANHLKSATSGFVVGTARPIHLGRGTHVWDIRIEAEETGTLICVSRLTVAILPKSRK